MGIYCYILVNHLGFRLENKFDNEVKFTAILLFYRNHQLLPEMKGNYNQKTGIIVIFIEMSIVMSNM